ncbi:MAG: glycosyltransferase family 4 protein [Fibrobacterota bacterium]|nr:glycosyltransferase family 4 protein [Fibrobacterota bacterium]
MIRVGFAFFFTDQSWLGGINYFRNLLQAVHDLPEGRIQPVILTGFNTDPGLMRDFPPIRILKTRMLDHKHPMNLLRKAIKAATGFDLLLEILCRRHGINVLSHSKFLRPGSKVKTLAWIFDFQHKHFPEWFDAREIKRRDSEFARACRHSDRVIVSSRTAQADLAAFHRDYTGKSRVLNFVAGIPKIDNALDSGKLGEEYRLPGKYFHVPNQFWIHKNHRVLVEALAVLRKDGRAVHLVATGHTHDNRHPRHFEELIGFAKQAGVEKEFQVLGIVPYGIMRTIMENSVAVLNPSLFEGWSTTVEEAKSLGKHTILSAIPVHLEQAPERGDFFDPGDPAALAETMWKVWNGYDKAADRLAMKLAERALEGRLRRFGLEYQAIVLEVAGRDR